MLRQRLPAKRRALAKIIGRWTAGCAEDGFDAVEFDNLGSFTRSRGLLSARDSRAFAASLVDRAHAEGLAAAQKNPRGRPEVRASPVGVRRALRVSPNVEQLPDRRTRDPCPRAGLPGGRRGVRRGNRSDHDRHSGSHGPVAVVSLPLVGGPGTWLGLDP
ncbi:MAG: endo alpha-1,4 polygalactosaminidase [Nocardioides sp.]